MEQEAVLPQFPVTTTDGNPTPAANPTPTQPQFASSHPSYAEMITAAILWDSSQGKAGGSSKRAIAKYIDRVYSNLPPTHSALLTHHLKRLKNSGNLVMIKNSYQLPVVAASGSGSGSGPGLASAAVPLRSAPPQTQPQNQTETQYEGGVSVSVTPKKRPGRPPKPKSEAQPTSTPVSSGNGLSTGKRPRGRPPRQQQPAVSEVPFVQPQAQSVYSGPDPGLTNGQSPQSVKRRPGRPSKKQQPQQFPQPVYEPEFEPSNQNLMVVPVNGTVSETPKRRPGRPPRAKMWLLVSTAPAAGGPRPRGKGRGRPKRNTLGPASRPIGKRPRGRPPRNQGAVLGVGVGIRIGGKRRGRPAKGSAAAGPSKPMRRYTGKPRGRPRKSASIGKIQSSEQVAVNEEVTKKVESMQATIRDAVGVLRPYLADENAADVMLALQQLEDLSTMDIYASPTPTEPPVTAMSVNATVQVQPNTSAPEPDSVTAPPQAGVTVPTADPPVVPFSITAPAMTETAPSLFAQPSTIEIQQPTSWIPSNEEQL